MKHLSTLVSVMGLFCFFIFPRETEAAPLPAPPVAGQLPQTTSVRPRNFGPHVPQTYTTHPSQLVDPAIAPALGAVLLAKLHTFLDSGGRVPLSSMRVSSTHRGAQSGLTYVYLQQELDGLDVHNGVANVNVDRVGRVISAGNSFFKGRAVEGASAGGGANGDKLAQTTAEGSTGFTPKLSASQAVLAFDSFIKSRVTAPAPLGVTSSVKLTDLKETPSDGVGAAPESTSQSRRQRRAVTVAGAPFAASSIKATLKYIQTDSGRSVRPGWELLVDMAGLPDFYSALVDAETGEVHSLFSLVSDLAPSASYNVFPMNDPDEGPRALVVDPAHLNASPFKWHSEGDGLFDQSYTDTQGNNVRAQSNPTGDETPIFVGKHRPTGVVGGADGGVTFDYPVDLSLDPKDYEDGAITNLFYWSNLVHDLYYEYGFDEVSGNFQTNNFGKGGIGLDPVLAFAQDGRDSGSVNNANFLTLPDGIPPVMRMYVWNLTAARGHPRRDGDLEAGIVVHECTHGLSTRLTGGAANVECLSTNEAGGMGEGWGDAVAIVIRTTGADTRARDITMGSYVTGNKTGIRRFPYSTNMTTNPHTYAFLNRTGYDEVHQIGEVWTVMLYEVYWNLIDGGGVGAGAGFTPNWFNSRLAAGNVVFLQLLVEGLKLQPCNPTFVDARNAILLADELFGYGGVHKCAIWKGFAKRGLGFSAKGPTNGGVGAKSWDGVESFDMPPNCELQNQAEYSVKKPLIVELTTSLLHLSI